MLENATRICGATFGTMMRLRAKFFRRAALYNAPPQYLEFSKTSPLLYLRISRCWASLGKGEVCPNKAACPDRRHGGGRAQFANVARLGQARTLLNVPMLKENELVGVIGIYRRGGPPLHRQADRAGAEFRPQAVIAIENTRPAQRTAESRYNSRPRPRMYSRSSLARPATWTRCSKPSWRMPPASARPSSGSFGFERAMGFVRSPFTAYRPPCGVSRRDPIVHPPR